MWSVHGYDVIPAELFETLRVDQKLKKQEAHAAETLMHHDFHVCLGSPQV